LLNFKAQLTDLLHRKLNSGWGVSGKSRKGLAVTLAALLGIGTIAYANFLRLQQTKAWVNHTHEVIEKLGTLISTLKDAETGQRGYLLTGDAEYLQPYDSATSAIDTEFKDTQSLTQDNPTQQQRLREIHPLIDRKMAELLQTIELRRAGRSEAALQVVRQNQGKETMDRLRDLVGEMQATEHNLLNQRVQADTTAVQNTELSVITACLFALAALIWSLNLINQEILQQRQIDAMLRKSEAKLRSLAESNVIGIVYADVAGNIGHANDEFLRIIGYERSDLEAGLLWTEITTPETLANSHQAIAQAQITGVGMPYEKEYIRKDGSRVPVLAGFVLSPESRQEAVAFVLDLSKQKQLEVTLRLQSDELQRASQLKDEFLGLVSHELRNPINPILGWSKLLLTRSLSPEIQHKALTTIERNAQLQLRLIDDLLDLTRMTHGKLRIALIAIAILPIIEAAIETAAGAVSEKSIDLELQLNPAQRKIRGDPTRLQQIVWNLLANAVKFTPEGGRVTVCLGYSETEAHIAVSDTGKGISPEFLPYVFDRFQQADLVVTRSNNGLGLGLSIVRYLVEAHCGAVRAESPGLGKGATFTVSLPLI
jgi:PAS domain S-box-containing protein